MDIPPVKNAFQEIWKVAFTWTGKKQIVHFSFFLPVQANIFITQRVRFKSKGSPNILPQGAVTVANHCWESSFILALSWEGVKELT